MTRPLRKRHLWMTMGLAILLPVVLYLAMRSRLPEPEPAGPLPGLESGRGDGAR